MPTVAVLLSSGRHPASGQVRAADLDGRALALAAALGTPLAVHAGLPGDPALADYLAMGLPRLDVIVAASADDVAAPLAAWLRSRRPDLILAGQRSEAPAGTGLLPYRLAADLDLPIVADVAQARLDGDGVEIEQAGAAGRRRRVRVAMPAVLVVGPAGPAAPAASYRRRQSGETWIVEPGVAPSAAHAPWTPALPRPVPLWIEAPAQARAAERIAAIRDRAGRGGQTLVGLDAAEAAGAVIDFLRSHEIITDTGMEVQHDHAP